MMLANKHFIPGREPRSSGNGGKLMFERSWVQIVVPFTGWAFFTLIYSKNYFVCFFEKTENKWKRCREWSIFKNNLFPSAFGIVISRLSYRDNFLVSKRLQSALDIIPSVCFLHASNYACCQCDHIERYFKVLGDKFSYKSSPNIKKTFGPLLKTPVY